MEVSDLAPCRSGSEANASNPALFALCVFIDTMQFHKHPACHGDESADLLLAIKFLSYDVVVIAENLTPKPYQLHQKQSQHHEAITLRHGKSCLFQVAPDELVHQMANEPMPINMLLLQRDPQHPTGATLLAFDAIQIMDKPRQRDLHKTQEWFNISGTWTLCDHLDSAILSITATASLVCHGSSLRVHLDVLKTPRRDNTIQPQYVNVAVQCQNEDDVLIDRPDRAHETQHVHVPTERTVHDASTQCTETIDGFLPDPQPASPHKAQTLPPTPARQASSPKAAFPSVPPPSIAHHQQPPPLFFAKPKTSTP